MASTNPFFDAVRAAKEWKGKGARAAGYFDMIRKAKAFKASQPKPFKKGGKVTVTPSSLKGKPPVSKKATPRDLKPRAPSGLNSGRKGRR